MMVGTRLIRAERVDDKKIELSWEAQAGVSGYRLYRKEGTGEEKLLKDLSAGTTSYVDGTVDLTTDYEYRLASYVKSGSKSLYFVSSNSVYCYATLPQFAMSLNTLQISFYHKEENATSSGYLDLGRRHHGQHRHRHRRRRSRHGRRLQKRH